MKPLIKIGVENSCTPISFFVPLTLPTKRYKKTPVKTFSGHTALVLQIIKKIYKSHLSGTLWDELMILSITRTNKLINWTKIDSQEMSSG